ncbi:MAG: SDR family oxidoreductase [Clostridia bacterium]|nr:SDR family oxidoreductase [Clostridia bacterium]
MKILITGSTQGIGRAMAEAFVRRGDDVIVHCSRDLAKAKRVRDEIGAASAVVCDLADMAQVDGLYAQTGPVDCLILNASVQVKAGWQDITDADFDRQMTVNVKSTLRLIQAYYPAMQAKHFGRIVTVGSVNQYRQHPELSMYAATKCAVMSLVKNIAKYAAPDGVTVNNIAPGAIATPRNAAVYDDPAAREAVEATIPLGRFGQPADCVGAVLLLCSEAGGYITGSDIVIDGGMHL